MNELGNGYDPEGEFYDPDEGMEPGKKKKKNALAGYSFTPKPRYTAGDDLYQMLMQMIRGQ